LAFFTSGDSCANVQPKAGMNMRGSKPKPCSPAGSRAISPTARPTATSGSGSSGERTATSVLTRAARRLSMPRICSSSAWTLWSSPLG
jgi:hypothetical protein